LKTEMSVRLETNVGDFVVDLFTLDAPKATFNFLKLCKMNYYAYSIFFRLEAGFLLQGGDPTNTGKGGESVWNVLNPADKSLRFFAQEIDVSKRKHKLRGTLSMASAGKDRNASQFFFTLADDLDFLDGNCTVFGQLTGASIKSELLGKEKDNSGGAAAAATLFSADTEDFFEYFNQVLFCDAQHRPLQDVYIIKSVVLNDPFPDPEDFKKYAELKRQPTEAFLKHRRIGAHEKVDSASGKKSEADLAAERRETVAKSNALVLEIIGDLPSADIKPPENVLFVCKLNPITRSDDLQMIFSRFGAIASCEVVRDRETGDSLGYAFIEFQEEKACEQAYLKMDNVLIDDRRIKVDFSQSVAKLHRKWEDQQRKKRRIDDRSTEQFERIHRSHYDRRIRRQDNCDDKRSCDIDCHRRHVHGPRSRSPERPRSRSREYERTSRR
jgi:peptidyl-prolyl cis-trans isomerase-like 4